VFQDVLGEQQTMKTNDKNRIIAQCGIKYLIMASSTFFGKKVA
jgi:hypothetical protein